jgi:hypothetical protein
MYFVELYDWTLIRLLHGLAILCDLFDRYVLDAPYRIGIWLWRR